MAHDKERNAFVCTEEDICQPPGPAPRAKGLPKPSEAESALLDPMLEAYRGLEKLGWQSIIYCPKDGTFFLAVEAGSAGVHICSYSGEWPNGSWWIHDGDMWPARPILWRPFDSEPERER